MKVDREDQNESGFIENSQSPDEMSTKEDLIHYDREELSGLVRKLQNQLIRLERKNNELNIANTKLQIDRETAEKRFNAMIANSSTRDKTSEKQANKILNENEGLFADLIANQTAGVYRIIFKKGDPTQTIWNTLSYEFVSDRYCDILGVERSMVMNDSANFMLNRIHPDDLGDFVSLNEESNRNFYPFSWEGRIVVNQIIKWVRFDSKPRKLDDGSVRWTGVVIDTTRQKLVEEMVKKNRVRLMRLSDCLSSLGPDSDLNIECLTALSGELLSARCALYSRLENDNLVVAGKWHFPDSYTGSLLPKDCIYSDVVKNNRDDIVAISNLQESAYSKDQYIIDLGIHSCYGKVVRSEGKAVGLLCLFYDVESQLGDEDRRIMGILSSAIGNENFRRYRREQHRANESKLKDLIATKDKFFSIIAHDLKSPFNGIIGFSSILKEEAYKLDTPTIIDYAGMINYSALQTHRLLENLLDWARMQQGKIAFNVVPNLLSPIVDEVIRLFSEMADRKKIALINQVPAQLNVMADTEMLKAVLRNLISNAIKFTDVGGYVHVEAIVHESDIQIVVTDNGSGIRPEDIDKLFNVGVTFSTHGTGNEKGTGLGLMLCKEFVEKHGGKITVESEPGVGSKFSFTLPQV